jgi:hypothetical protein
MQRPQQLAHSAPGQLHARQLTAHVNSAPSPAELQRLLQDHAADIDHIHASAAFVALKRLCQADRRLVPQQQTQRALQHLEQQVLTPQLVAQCGARELANIIHASAHLSAASVIASLLPVFMGQLQEAEPQAIANTM